MSSVIETWHKIVETLDLFVAGDAQADRGVDDLEDDRDCCYGNLKTNNPSDEREYDECHTCHCVFFPENGNLDEAKHIINTVSYNQNP